jgi:hypothetical protein
LDASKDTAMLDTLLDPVTQEPRNPGFWWATGALTVTLLATFWLVCTHQVEQAQARNAEHQMAQTALADCLQYIPGATIATCTQRISPDNATQTAAVDAATPVGYTIR